MSKKVLIVKTSSMGDVIHTLPALTDATKYFPDIHFDWVVENDFAEIPSWHRSVNEIIPVAIRRWRKQPLKALFSQEWKNFRQKIKSTNYDYIIDAQGLTKSALIARMAKGKRFGLDKQSARDKFAFIHYHERFPVPWGEHAVQRVRRLFALSLGYPMPNSPPDYGIREHWQVQSGKPYLVFLHATTWTSKLWPESYWKQLAEYASSAGYDIYLNSGNPEEYQRAQRIAAGIQNVYAMSRKKIVELAELIRSATMAVALDTGLAHLAAALATPTVSLYSSTNPDKTGAFGPSQLHLKADFVCAPCMQKTCNYQGASEVKPACFATMNPDFVWKRMLLILKNNENNRL